MMLSIGTRVPILYPKVIYEGSPSNVQSVTDKIAPGYIYEFQFTVSPEVKKEDLDKAYDILRAIENKIPGIGLNYMGISDDGKTVIFQVFDPPFDISLGTIIALIIGAIIAVITYLIVDKIYAITQLIMGKLPPAPPWTGGLFWTAVSVALIGMGISMIVKTFKK